MNSIWVILLAAGQSSRLQKQGIAQKKQFLSWKGYPLFWHSALKFAKIPEIKGIICTFPPEDVSYAQNLTKELKKKKPLGIPFYPVPGGELRQDSVYNGLKNLPQECDYVLVHDAARPFFSAKLVVNLIEAFTQDLGGVIPGLACKDTIKKVSQNLVLKTLARKQLMAVQTPQFFPKDTLIKAHEKAQEENFTATDDASMVENLGLSIRVIPGEEKNIKITTKEDLNMLTENTPTPVPCVGFGYDVHRYGGPRPMILAGVPIPGGPTVFAHSDGDVLYHALTDAILGCLGAGDIGEHFPDSDPQHEGQSSSVFLTEALHMAQKQNLRLMHIDLTIVAQVPKLAPYKKQIKKNIAGLTGLRSDQINVKATTEEGLGFTGSKKGIKAIAVVTAIKEEVGETES
ncbi:2-C-methyl-D-erythritol 4-phosphate cytidylyltransferase [Desulfohalobiaceae bacterium Ax17]|uniref:2-C-methyl-D-erythritol 4-phosphate cytidylyltransferase n=1 Tax=Desulfovulcanus ferrireducens TaxID=2831190 RepID=UPI00207BC1DC|nr:2-C-methyl-D-erythritol 4-phosphate cytidylyltransferase [Desulfovulcanus ferrireducens]MBT8763721.1 2-C-methyl-D-erythritol 4-phosphate cytidylyltransferase [Desulfovulcanus ferrireducens]